MDEGKLASQALSGSDSDAEDESGEEDSGIKMRGRFRSPASDNVDLSSDLSEDDEAVKQVAKRFRSSAQAHAFGAADSAPSLDEQGGESEMSDDELQNFLLEALDEEEQEDPVDDSAATTDEAESRTDRMVDDEVADTQRMDAKPPKQEEGVTCPSCHADNPPGMRYCVQCGGSLESAASASGPQRVAPAEPQREPPPPSEAAKQENPHDIHLISINEDGSDGISIPLEYLETTLGRDGDTRFPTDAFLSPKHARLHIEDGKLFIEDLYSLNGTFLKLRDEMRMTPGDTFLMGRQVLRFERFEQSITPKTKSSDGTRYMGSPAPGGNHKILQIGIGNVVQNVYCLPESGAVLGREKGDIIFPHDKFMSSRHAQLFTGEDGQSYLVDLNSSNGTWIKIWEKTNLEKGDYIFMGQQLFRVHIGTSD